MVDRVAAEIERLGSISFDRYMELALYADPGGFFATGRGAGRQGRDFLTSPETGPVFGAMVSRVIDREWRALGEPDPFVVVEAGAGNGRLAREVLRATPACRPALLYVLVERSAALRAEQRDLLEIEPPGEAHPGRAGPIVTSLETLPAIGVGGVLIANELLDNLPFALAEWDGARWHEVRVGAGRSPVLAPIAPGDEPSLAPFGRPAAGARVPMPRALDAWFRGAGTAIDRGRLVLIDYCVDAAQLIERGERWLRTYRDHERGHDPFAAAPGECDITGDVVLQHVERAARAAGFGATTVTPQAEWLRALGIDDHVVEGDRIWNERAVLGDLAALEARSRRTQAAALTDPDGLGGFTVLELPRTRA